MAKKLGSLLIPLVLRNSHRNFSGSFRQKRSSSYKFWLAPTALVSFFLGGLTYHVVWNKIDRHDPYTNLPLSADSPSSHLLRKFIQNYGLPVGDDVLLKNGFIVGYDRRTRLPRYTLEVVTHDSLKGDNHREGNAFRQDRDIPERFRAKDAVYRGSGYDRGHMVAAANARESEESIRDSFALSNVCPQVGKGFNRHYWARLEELTRRLVSSGQYEHVYVITGPLFLPDPGERSNTPRRLRVKYDLLLGGADTTNDNGGRTGAAAAVDASGALSVTPSNRPGGFLSVPPVAVPTHFFKVVVACGRRNGGLQPRDNLLSANSLAGPLPYPPGGAGGEGGGRRNRKSSTVDSTSTASSSSATSEGGDPVVAAFVLPNRSIPAAVPLAKFKVPLQQLEMWAGLELFPVAGDQEELQF